MPKQPRVLKPIIDNLDLAIGQDANIATLRGQLTALREQAEAVESERDIFKAERDDFKARLSTAESENIALRNEISAWQNAKENESQYPEGANPGL
jgi:chromosome segregation ATPase